MPDFPPDSPSDSPKDPLRERSDAVHALREEFRRHVETFYGQLQLAPPYHSVEKAVSHLTTTLMTMTPEDVRRFRGDADERWALFGRVFVESGLSQKHRGILVGAVRQGRADHLPPEYTHFLNAFRP